MSQPLPPMTDAELADARKLCDAMSSWTYDEDDNEWPCCADCGHEYRLECDDRPDPTPLCDGCAQRAVERIRPMLDEIDRQRTEIDGLRARVSELELNDDPDAIQHANDTCGSRCRFCLADEVPK